MHLLHSEPSLPLRLLLLEGSGLTLLLMEDIMCLHMKLHDISPSFVSQKLECTPPAGHLGIYSKYSFFKWVFPSSVYNQELKHNPCCGTAVLHSVFTYTITWRVSVCQQHIGLICRVVISTQTAHTHHTVQWEELRLCSAVWQHKQTDSLILRQRSVCSFISAIVVESYLQYHTSRGHHEVTSSWCVIFS